MVLHPMPSGEPDVTEGAPVIRTRVIPVAAFCAALLALAPQAFASGILDPTFGTNGTVLTTLDHFSGADDQLIQGDGKIVVAGVTAPDAPQPTYDVVVLRYSNVGALDPTFGNAGVVRIPLGGSASVGGVAIDQRGRILVDGAVNGSGFVIRLTDVGVPDVSFGGTGTVLLSPPGHTGTGVGDLLIVGRARPLVVGESQNGSHPDLMLVRLLPSGAPDLSFAVNGYAFFSVPGGGSADGYTLAHGPNGTTYVGGSTTPTGGESSPTVFRFTAAGSLDLTFSQDGVRPFWVGGPGLGPIPTGIVVRSGGLAVLSWVVPDSGSSVFALTAFTSSGRFDQTFGGGDGKQVYDPTAGSDAARAVVQESDGSLVMVGGSQGSVLVLRVSASGVPDNAFGPGGLVISHPDPSSDISQANAVSIEDGKILTSGTTGKAIFLQRFSG
jgi:uncharacterized delta-60 repeat protein